MEKGIQANQLKEPFRSAYDACKIAKGILAGGIAEKQGDYHLARQHFTDTVDAEDSLIYIEPREWPIPARQYAGNLLLLRGDYNESISVFQRDLQNNPVNGWSLTGLKRAYKATHEESGIVKISSPLKESWQIKDIRVESLVF